MIKLVRAYPRHLMVAEVDKVNKARNLTVVHLPLHSKLLLSPHHLLLRSYVSTTMNSYVTLNASLPPDTAWFVPLKSLAFGTLDTTNPDIWILN